MTTRIDTPIWKRILTDIRFWILLFFLIRLIGITNAPLEIGHNWRQALTNMISRNFHEASTYLMYPQIDMAGNQMGIIGSEFPLYNYLIGFLAHVFDYAHWYGRIINLVVSSFGIYFFFLLISKVSTKKIAVSATIVLLASIWFGFSRKIMPDTFSVSLVIIGLYYGYMYVTTGARFKLLLFFLFITLGMLCKIPALSLVAVIRTLLFVKEIDLKRKLAVFVTAGVSVGIVALWYFYWVPYLISTYGYQLYFPKGLIEGFMEITPLLPEFFEKFYFSAFHSYIALGFMVVGIVFSWKGDLHRYVKLSFVFIALVFGLFILKTGAVFPLHSYYIIPFVPVMAVLAGVGLARIPNKHLFIPLLFIAIEGIGNQQHDFFIKDSEKHKLSLESIANAHIPYDALVVVNGGASPQEIYFAHRRGWTVENEEINQHDLEDLHQSGASFLIINRHRLETSIEYLETVYSDKNYIIYTFD